MITAALLQQLPYSKRELVEKCITDKQLAWLPGIENLWGENSALEQLITFWTSDPETVNSQTESTSSPEETSSEGTEDSPLIPSGKLNPSWWRRRRAKRPLTKRELVALKKELAPLLLLLLLKEENEKNEKYRLPTRKETIEEANSSENQDKPKEDLSTSKKIFFRSFCAALGLLGAAEGAVGGYALVQYLSDVTNCVLGDPVSIAFAVFFGLISLGIVTAVDLVFVANSMDVDYLTAGKKLKALGKEAKEINNLLEELEITLTGILERLSAESVKPLALAQLEKELGTCQNLLATLKTKHEACHKDFTAYQKAFAETRIKRTVFRITWIILTALIYAAAANLTATNVLGAAMLFSPIGIGISVAVATLWICIELFRFYNFERKNIASAMNVAFGTTTSAYCDAAHATKSSAKLINRNTTFLSSAKDRHSQKHTNPATLFPQPKKTGVANAPVFWACVRKATL